MARWFGKVGYVTQRETSPGVWTDESYEREKYGDITRISRRFISVNQASDDVKVSNVVSIVADTYDLNHLFAIKYVVFGGAKWKVDNIEVQHPRLLLTLGGIYNV